METQTILMRGMYNAVLPTANDGDHPKLAVDINGRIVTSPGTGGAIATADTNGDVTNLVVSAVPATLHAVYGFNAAAAARYIQFHDAAALPANGVLPAFTAIYAAPGTNFSWVFKNGWAAANGIVIACSSTRGTLTIALANDMWASVEYEV